MNRRFQFSVRTVMVMVATAAVCCSIWIRLPLAARLAIGGTGFATLIWTAEWFDYRALLDWVVRGGANQRYVIKRRGEPPVDEGNG